MVLAVYAACPAFSVDLDYLLIPLILVFYLVSYASSDVEEAVQLFSRQNVQI